MYCNSCGKLIEDGSAFCRHCGIEQKFRQESLVTQDLVALSEEDHDRTKSLNSLNYIVVGGIVALLILLMIGTNMPKQLKVPTQAAPNAQIDPVIAEANDVAAAAASAAKEANDALKNAASPSNGTWSYSNDEDKVRGSNTFYATTTSTNSVYQSPPYNANTTMNLTIRQSWKSGVDVMLVISSGQMMCPSYSGCSATVRIDDGRAETISLNGASDNSSETVFVVGAKGFVAKLKKAKHVVIEKTLYQAGNPQFEFDVGGLNWDHR